MLVSAFWGNLASLLLCPAKTSPWHATVLNSIRVCFPLSYQLMQSFLATTGLIFVDKLLCFNALSIPPPGLLIDPHYFSLVSCLTLSGTCYNVKLWKSSNLGFGRTMPSILSFCSHFGFWGSSFCFRLLGQRPMARPTTKCSITKN